MVIWYLSGHVRGWHIWAWKVCLSALVFPYQGDGQAQEKGYPKGMPNYIKHTGGIPFAHVKQLMRFRTGAHHLWVETGRWLKPRLPRSLRVCQKCTWGSTVEDEYHVLFECPAYHRIRLKYETALFSKFGGVSRVARSMKFPGKVTAFMDQEPRKVAAFVCVRVLGL